MKLYLSTAAFLLTAVISVQAQPGKPQDTEVWNPVPLKVSPAKIQGGAPSDAVVLFDGKDLNQWVNSADTASAKKWELSAGVITVDKTTGDIQTKAKFMDFQLHIEYLIPENITGSDQARGNSGIFLAALPWGAGGYELQVLDNYTNKTYVNGQAGSLYKQSPPLVNACLQPGQWQTYEVIWTAPRFNPDGSLQSAAVATVFHNGILVQNATVLKGDTPYIGKPEYRQHGASPIKLQSHGDKSEPISYRNIWLRKL
jgi:hypothetical protein